MLTLERDGTIILQIIAQYKIIKHAGDGLRRQEAAFHTVK